MTLRRFTRPVLGIVLIVLAIVVAALLTAPSEVVADDADWLAEFEA